MLEAGARVPTPAPARPGRRVQVERPRFIVTPVRNGLKLYAQRDRDICAYATVAIDPRSGRLGRMEGTGSNGNPEQAVALLRQWDWEPRRSLSAVPIDLDRPINWAVHELPARGALRG